MNDISMCDAPFVNTFQNGYHDLPKRTGTDRNGQERTETDLRKYRNGLLWVPKRTGTDFSGYRNGPEQTSSYRNELQWEPEKVGWGTIGTILTKLCMYWLVGS